MSNSTGGDISFSIKSNEEGIKSISRKRPFGDAEDYNCGRTRFSIRLIPVNDKQAAVLYINESQMTCFSTETPAGYDRKAVFHLRPNKTITVSKTYQPVILNLQVKASDNSHMFLIRQTVEVAVANVQALYESSANNLGERYDDILNLMGQYFLQRVRAIAMEFPPSQNRMFESALINMNTDCQLNQPEGESFLDYLSVRYNSMKWVVTLDSKVQTKIDASADNRMDTDQNIDSLKYTRTSLEELKALLPAYYFDNEDYMAIWFDVTAGKRSIDDARSEIDKRLEAKKNIKYDDAKKRAELMKKLVDDGLISEEESRRMFGTDLRGTDSSSYQQTRRLGAASDNVSDDDAFDDEDFPEED